VPSQTVDISDVPFSLPKIVELHRRDSQMACSCDLYGCVQVLLGRLFFPRLFSSLHNALFGSSGFNIGEQDLRRMLEQFLPPSDNKLLLDLQQEVFSRLSSFAESVRALGNVSLAVLIFTGIALRLLLFLSTGTAG